MTVEKINTELAVENNRHSLAHSSLCQNLGALARFLWMYPSQGQPGWALTCVLEEESMSTPRLVAEPSPVDVGLRPPFLVDCQLGPLWAPGKGHVCRLMDSSSHLKSFGFLFFHQQEEAPCS